LKDKNYRSILKSISWRITGTIDTFLISYFITGKFTIAMSISGVEILTKFTLYYFHEMLWNKINIGREKEIQPEYEI